MITQLGKKASDILASVPEGSVMGKTSRGAFLAFPPGRVIFLSVEPFLGPLTINLPAGLDGLNRLALGDPVAVRSASLVFPSLGQALSTSAAPVWEAPPPTYPEVDRVGLPRRLLNLSLTVLEGLGPGAHPSLLSEAVCILDREAKWLKGRLYPNFVRLSLALEEFLNPSRDPSLSSSISQGTRLVPAMGAPAGLALIQEDRPFLGNLISALEFFVGRGQGLTPAGDDLILGLILALNRWQLLFYPGVDLEQLNAEIIALTKERTTTLSSALVECASLGQADERLVNALDWLLTGKPGLEAVADGLLSWGSSSGSDSLAGMALALSHVSEGINAD